MSSTPMSSEPVDTSTQEPAQQGQGWRYSVVLASPDTEVVPGDWVLVYGQVNSEDISHHPSDLVIRLESHSEHYAAHIRGDRVLPLARAPEFAPMCSAMSLVGKTSAYVRCDKASDHSGTHYGGGHLWDDHATAGYFEKA